VGSCSLGLPNNVGNEEAIWALISAESKSVVSQDIDRLMRLWSEDARITDAKHTPDDPSDDQTVQGQDAIRYRYTHIVFPSAPGSAQAENLDIHILGNQAQVTSTTHIGDVISPRGNHWQMARVNGCWVLQELVYNLTPGSRK
jgi:ketosteroid isomerase-like protein